jgi:hypothetical protein
MKTTTIARGVISSICLLTITGIAQACYYEGDPVLTPSGYDVPVTGSDNDCYYGGDPVMESSGHFDNPIVLSQGSYYYTADLQEQTLRIVNTEETSEFSAFEHETDDSSLPVASIIGHELDNHEWIPQAWNMSY